MSARQTPAATREAAARSEALRLAAVPVAVPRRDYTRRRLLAVADLAALALALVVAFALTGDGEADGLQLAWGLLLLPVWILLFKVYGLYDRDGKRVNHSTVDEAPWLFHALVTGSFGLWLVMALVPALSVTVSEALAFLAATFVGVSVLRASAREVAVRVIPPERVLFAGGGTMARVLARKIIAHPEYGLEPIGYVDASDDGEAAEPPLPCLGTLADLGEICRRERVERIVVASPAVEEGALADLIRVATGLDLRISILPHLSDVLGPAVTVDDVEGVTVLGLNPPALTPSSRLLKRGMDLAVAVPVLTLALPLMLLTAVLVKTTSPGPVLYRQERIGRGGRRFRIYKFRTMVADADARADELRRHSSHPVWLLLDHDPRVTAVGRLLRRTSLDELPQLWNVLLGDMSLVGPRPMPPDVDERISGWGRRRLDLTPGITGLWQVLGRTSIPFEEMVKLDYLYVTNWSLWQDVRLLIRTLPAVLRRRGAN